ncbi:hypothetical protein Aduo_007872 [Ancylostoma duodenale]
MAARRDKCRTEEILRKYPLDVFPNWNITADERYYVSAPVDQFGEWAFRLRSHLTALILSGNPAIGFLQSMHSETMTKVARAFSILGLEVSFFSLIVAMVWLFDARLGRLLSVLLSLGFFVSGSFKVSLCLPRPPSPPALCLDEENRDWAWPSNHALLGTTFPWFIWNYSSSHYNLSLWSSVIFLAVILTWNCGVSWSRVYLGVHSPCDVLGGWTIGVLLLFIFGGFSDKLYDAYESSSSSDLSFFVYFYSAILFLLWAHPRAWPETQSYGELICVLSGTGAIWAGRVFHLGGPMPSVSLAESHPDAAIYQYFLRFFVGEFFQTVSGVAIILTCRVLLKPVAKLIITGFYNLLDLKYYSYSQMCKDLGGLQPTKRYTNRMRFKPIPGMKVVPPELIPYDIDLPVKFIVYSMVGFFVSEGCPAIFTYLNI